MEEPLDLLRHEVDTAKSGVVKLLLSARGSIEDRISRGARDTRRIMTAKGRNQVYGEINNLYDALDANLDVWARDLTTSAAISFREEAVRDVAAVAQGELVPRFSRKHFLKYYEQVGLPAQSGEAKVAGLHIAAAKTQNMRRQTVGQLRGITSQVFLESALTGATNKQIQRDLSRRWLDVAEGDPGLDVFDFFVDRKGRTWKNSNYFNMLARTLPANVAREAYADSMALAGVEAQQNGSADDALMFDLAEITGGSQPCPTCSRWRGVIVSVSGLDKNHPSKQDAIDAGVWHPNCVCGIGMVDRDVDEDRIAAQAALSNPKGATKDELNAYADDVQRRAKDSVRTDTHTGALRASVKKDRALKGAATRKRKATKAFHATDVDFDEFDEKFIGKTDTGLLGRGFYFSTDPNIGRSAKITLSVDVDVGRSLNLEMGEWFDNKAEIVRNALGLPLDASATAVRDAAVDKGYKSIVLDYSRLGYNQQEIVVFSKDRARITGKTKDRAP